MYIMAGGESSSLLKKHLKYQLLTGQQKKSTEKEREDLGNDFGNGRTKELSEGAEANGDAAINYSLFVGHTRAYYYSYYYVLYTTVGFIIIIISIVDRKCFLLWGRRNENKGNEMIYIKKKNGNLLFRAIYFSEKCFYR